MQQISKLSIEQRGNWKTERTKWEETAETADIRGHLGDPADELGTGVNVDAGAFISHPATISGGRAERWRGRCRRRPPDLAGNDGDRLGRGWGESGVEVGGVGETK